MQPITHIGVFFGGVRRAEEDLHATNHFKFMVFESEFEWIHEFSLEIEMQN